MLGDITLGQYLPGNTVVDRLDPRMKNILTILYIALIFCVASPVWYVIPLAYLFLVSMLWLTITTVSPPAAYSSTLA